MSEYIAVEVETGDDPDVVRLITNLKLAPDGPESYASRADGDEGSPLAQFIFGIDGLDSLDILDNVLVVRRHPDVEWHDLVDEITAALKEFFL